MIVRVYTDNYKCLVNFEFRPKQLQLVLGLNGTGKSTLFEVLGAIRRLLFAGHTVDQMFEASTLTRWDKRPIQTFELEVLGNGGTYVYEPVLEHQPERQLRRVQKEELRFDNGKLYAFDGREAHLFRDDFSAGPTFPFDWLRSGVSSIQPRGDNRLLTWFRQRIGRIVVLSLNPWAITEETKTEDPYLQPDCCNLASWYRHIVQENPEIQEDLFNSLRQVIDGFSTMKLSMAGERTRLLQARMKAQVEDAKSEATYELSIAELSEGQRALIALYAILHYAVNADTTLCIDEPENFIALPEIQPWLMALRDKVSGVNSQAILASHHPELIDYLAHECGVRFVRHNGGPIRVKPFATDKQSGLSASELIARGWEDE